MDASQAQIVLAALMTQHSPDANPSQRENALKVTEEFKRNFNVSLPIALQFIAEASGPQAAEIRHFGLHVLEYVVTKGWNAITDQQRDFLKQQALQLIPTSQSYATQGFIKQKVASIVAEIAKREWPQRWSDMLERLLAGASANDHTLELSVMVLRDLSEEVIEFSPHLPDKRRKEIKAGLLAAMPQLFPWLLSTLGTQFEQWGKAGKAATRLSMLTGPLQAFTALLPFLPDAYLFEKGLLPALLTLLPHVELCGLVLDLVHEVASRREATLDKQYLPQLQRVWDTATQFTQSALPSLRADSPVLKKALSVLERLTKLHSGLLAADNMEATRTRTLALLGQLLANNSLRVSMQATELWIHLFKQGDSVIKPNYRAGLLPELFKVAVVKLTKKDADLREEMEFESEEEYVHFFGAYRGAVLRLVELMMSAEPVICLSITLARYKQVLAQSPPAEQLPLRVSSAYFRDVEAVGALLDYMTRRVTAEMLQQAQFTAMLKELLTLILQMKTTDPLLVTRKFHDLALFTALYESHQPALSAVLDTVIAGVQFRPPGEEQKPWVDLSEDVRAARRRACYTMVTIAKKIPTTLLPLLGELVNRTLKLSSSGTISESEKILLYECLVHVSRSMPDARQQSEFVLGMLRDPVQHWTADTVTAMLTDRAKFLALIGVNDEEQQNPNERKQEAPARQMRTKMQHVLSTCAAVLKSVFSKNGLASPESSTPHPAAAALNAVLPNVLRFIGAVHVLYTPQGSAALPPSMRPMLAVTKGHLNVLTDSKASNLVSDVHSWLSVAMEHSYALLGIAAKSGPQFFSTHNPQMFIDTVFVHAAAVPNKHLRLLIDKFVGPLIKRCPGPLMRAFLSRLLRGLTATLFARLTQDWSRVMGTSGSSAKSNEQLEILEETELRELSRVFLFAFMKGLALREHDADTVGTAKYAQGTSKKKSMSEEERESKEGAKEGREGKEEAAQSAFAQYLATENEVLEPLLACLAGAITWNDHLTSFRATRLCLALLPLTVEQRKYHAVWAGILHQCLRVLADSRPELLESGHLETIALVKSIYNSLGRVSDAPRAALASLPGVEPAEIKNLEDMLSTEASDRRQRQAFKAFLVQHVLGMARPGTDSAAKIKDLSEQLVLKSRKVAEQNVWATDHVGLSSLFSE